MSFRPLKTGGKPGLGVQMGYTTHAQKGKNKGKCVMLAFSICDDLIRALKVKSGDYLRLDADTTAGMARLLPVGALGASSRVVHLNKSGRGEWAIPYTGEIKETFPHVLAMTPLGGAHVSSEDGLLFDLPKAEQAEG